MTESQLLYSCIASHHNKKIIDNALDILKQFSREDSKILLYDKDGNSFYITPDTKWIHYEFYEEEKHK